MTEIHIPFPYNEQHITLPFEIHDDFFMPIKERRDALVKKYGRKTVHKVAGERFSIYHCYIKIPLRNKAGQTGLTKQMLAEEQDFCGLPLMCLIPIYKEEYYSRMIGFSLEVKHQLSTHYVHVSWLAEETRKKLHREILDKLDELESILENEQTL